MKHNYQTEKNLNDLDYSTSLNYLNISLITLATIWATFIFGVKISSDIITEIKFKAIGTFVAILTTIVIILLFNEKLKRIEEKIRKLDTTPNI